MRRIVAKLIIGVAITAMGMFAADSSVGTWKYNAAKSKITGNYPIKSQTDVREATPDGGAKVTRTGQLTDGTPSNYSFSHNFDGKEYPVVGSSSVYSYSEEPGVVHETQKDADGTITKGDFTVSAKGNVGTWLYTITNPDGSVIKQKLVFDRTV